MNKLKKLHNMLEYLGNDCIHNAMAQFVNAKQLAYSVSSYDRNTTVW